MNSYETYSLIIQLLIALGTIAVAILAIWGGWVKMKVASPRLRIEPHNFKGTLTRFTGGPRVIYYHLKVTNARHWVIPRNCRVILRSVLRRMPNNEFESVPVHVPPQFVWAPAELTPPVIELSTQQVFDFGRVVENVGRFEPVLYSYPNDFNGFVQANEAVRYAIEIRADGFSARQLQVFEVAWNGKWTDNLDTMTHNLTIREVDSLSI